MVKRLSSFGPRVRHPFVMAVTTLECWMVECVHEILHMANKCRLMLWEADTSCVIFLVGHHPDTGRALTK